MGKRIPKRDRYGIWREIERTMLEFYALIISAAFSEKSAKLDPLREARVKIEIIKRLTRSSHELHIINEQNYLVLIEKFQQLSKMTNGWIGYLNK